MSSAQQSKGKQALNPLLAFTLIPFLPMDSDSRGQIRTEERKTRDVPGGEREHKSSSSSHKHRHHHHHHHHKSSSEDSTKSSSRHSVDSSRSTRSSDDGRSGKTVSYGSERRNGGGLPRSSKEYFVLEPVERSSRRWGMCQHRWVFLRARLYQCALDELYDHDVDDGRAGCGTGGLV